MMFVPDGDISQKIFHVTYAVNAWVFIIATKCNTAAAFVFV